MSNPSTALKSKTLDTYAAEAVAAGTFTGSAIEVPRGAQDISFQLDGTLFDRGTGNETYTFKVQGRDNSAHGWVDLPGCAFTTIEDTTGQQQLPTAANAPGLTVPKYIRVHLTSVGTTPIATAVIRMRYNLPRGAGNRANNGPKS